MTDTELVVADIGGTHARFALARMREGNVEVEPPVTLATADYRGLADAWRAFGERCARTLPRCAAFAVAGPVRGDTVRMTNGFWQFDKRAIDAALSLEHSLFLNDFEAVAHAVRALSEDGLAHVAGPRGSLVSDVPISVVGPGTGLGVALALPAGEVRATEGGHVAFAPLDPFEHRLRDRLAKRYERVSAERVVSGPGLRAIAQTLADDAALPNDDAALWSAALEGGTPLLDDALDRFCRCLGSVAGDIALAHGPGAVAIAGGLGRRLAPRLHASGFAERFVAKGRYEALMRTVPVVAITHPEPGLLGAATAYRRACEA